MIDFTFVDQELERHTDRPACEISVTLQISTNREEPWDIWFNDFKSENANVSMNNGDACIYRDATSYIEKPLESKYTKFQNYYRRLKKLDDDTITTKYSFTMLMQTDLAYNTLTIKRVKNQTLTFQS